MKTTYYLTLVLIIIFPPKLFSQTFIAGGEVGGTWTLANSPYIIQDDISVFRDSMLTIEAGVEIRFDQGVNFNIFSSSSLMAIGNAQNPIVFTSNSNNPEPGDWGRINSSGNGDKSTFKHCIIEYADRGVFFYALARGCSSSNNLNIMDSTEVRFCNIGLYCLGAGSSVTGCIPIAKTGSSSPSISNSYIHHNVNEGITLDARDGFNANGSVTARISRTIIELNGKEGIRYLGDDPVNPTIFNNLIQHNGMAGLRYEENSSNFGSLRVYNNILLNNAVGVQADSANLIRLGYNNLWNNATNYIGISAPASDLATDPLFLDENARDYRLSCSSPCIDAGDPDVDLDPDGTIADIGLFANQGIVTPSISGETTFCYGDSITISGPSGFVSYLWSNGDSSTSIIVSDSGEFSLVVSNEMGCVSDSSDIFRVIEKPMIEQPEILLIGGNLGDYFESSIEGDTYQWYFEGDSIEGADQKQHVPRALGLYQVEVWVDGCKSALSVAYGLFPTSADDLFEAAGFKLYPNPASQKLYVEIPESMKGELSLAIFSLNGEVVWRQSVERSMTDRIMLNLVAVPSGMYLLRIVHRTKYFQKSFLVN